MTDTKDNRNVTKKVSDKIEKEIDARKEMIVREMNERRLMEGPRPNTQVIRESENVEGIRELNKDEADPINPRYTSIDMRANLNDFEINSIMTVEMLDVLEVIPHECTEVTRKKKRMSVSRDGKGREQIVDMFRANKEQEAQKSGILKRAVNSFMGGSP
jgi:hypothetical protein